MNFCVRPSKSFLFDLLEKRLRRYKAGIGIDAASASFKNRRMFKTEKYLGLDIELSLLQKGLSEHKSPDTLGILADIAKLDSLPSGIANVVVSTNTLYHLQPQLRLQAVEHLCWVTSPEGIFLCDFPIDDNFDQSLKIFKKYFDKVEVIYYRNLFDQFYEKIFEQDGFLGTHSIAGTKPFRLFAWFLSRLNFLTGRLKFLNSGAIIICEEKKDRQRSLFDINKIPQIDDRLFTLIKEDGITKN